jgi:hypothetical protein
MSFLKGVRAFLFATADQPPALPPALPPPPPPPPPPAGSLVRASFGLNAPPSSHLPTTYLAEALSVDEVAQTVHLRWLDESDGARTGQVTKRAPLGTVREVLAETPAEYRAARAARRKQDRDRFTTASSHPQDEEVGEEVDCGMDVFMGDDTTGDY